MHNDLFSHMAWADAVVLRAARACPEAEHDPVIREKLHHLHMVQRAFLHLWTRSPMALRELDTFPDLASIEAWAREYHAEVHSFVEALGERALVEIVPIPWAERISKIIGVDAPAPVDLGTTMTQVAMHSSYHRGQVNMRLRELGSVPPLTDYIAWCWIGNPAPAWASP